MGWVVFVVFCIVVGVILARRSFRADAKLTPEERAERDRQEAW